MEQIQEFENEARNDLIEGRNAVMEALRAGRTIDKIFIAKGDVDKTLGHIASKARSAGIVVTEADRRKLDAMSQTHAHQGVIALCAVKEYSTIEDMLAIAAELVIIGLQVLPFSPAALKPASWVIVVVWIVLGLVLRLMSLRSRRE